MSPGPGYLSTVIRIFRHHFPHPPLLQSAGTGGRAPPGNKKDAPGQSKNHFLHRLAARAGTRIDRIPKIPNRAEKIFTTRSSNFFTTFSLNFPFFAHAFRKIYDTKPEAKCPPKNLPSIHKAPEFMLFFSVSLCYNARCINAQERDLPLWDL